MTQKIAIAAVAIIATFTVFSSQSQAQINGVFAPTLNRNYDRDWIRSLPIEMRPNRPFHFYGNTVRRLRSIQAAPVRPFQGFRAPAPAFTPRPMLRVPLFRRW